MLIHLFAPYPFRYLSFCFFFSCPVRYNTCFLPLKAKRLWPHVRLVITVSPPSLCLITRSLAYCVCAEHPDYRAQHLKPAHPSHFSPDKTKQIKQSIVASTCSSSLIFRVPKGPRLCWIPQASNPSSGRRFHWREISPVPIDQGSTLLHCEAAQYREAGHSKYYPYFASALTRSIPAAGRKTSRCGYISSRDIVAGWLVEVVGQQHHCPSPPPHSHAGPRLLGINACLIVCSIPD